MDYSGGAGKQNLSPQDRQALMGNIKQQLDVAHAQELLMTINEKCFKMCVQKPGTSLSSSDQVRNLISLKKKFYLKIFKVRSFD